jgi:hypothetical protein
MPDPEFTKTEGELKKIARDLLQGKIFCLWHLPPGDLHAMESTFMVLALMERDMIEVLIENWGKAPLIYEYIDRAGPLAINGNPIFTSCKWIHTDQVARFTEIYESMKAALDAATA